MHDLLAGRALYPAPTSPSLAVPGHAFLTPPLPALATVPLTVLPYTAALVAWSAISIAMLVAGLALLGMRDPRLYVISICSFPFVESLAFGQTEGVLILAAAVAWRCRSSWKGAVAVGVMLAVKPITWPLILWLLFTRRARGAAVAAASVTVLVLVSWACVDFKGLVNYPELLQADAHAAVYFYAPMAGALHLGASRMVATLSALTLTALMVSATLAVATRRDESLFTVALIGGLLASPILEVHYLALLLVPLAISRRTLDVVWLLFLALWLLAVQEQSGLWQVAIVLAIAATVAVFVNSGVARGTKHQLAVIQSEDAGALPV
jgi:hypothetical protein